MPGCSKNKLRKREHMKMMSNLRMNQIKRQKHLVNSLSEQNHLNLSEVLIDNSQNNYTTNEPVIELSHENDLLLRNQNKPENLLSEPNQLCLIDISQNASTASVPVTELSHNNEKQETGPDAETHRKIRMRHDKPKYRYHCLGKRKRKNTEALQKANEARMRKRKESKDSVPTTSSDLLETPEVKLEIEDRIVESTVNVEPDTAINEFVVKVEETYALDEENTINLDIQGRRVIDFSYFLEQLFAIDLHGKAFGCTLNQLKFLNEKQSGLLSEFRVKCTMCESIFYLKTSKENYNNKDVNLSAVSGATANGIDFTNLNVLSTSMDLPIIPFLLYSKCHDQITKINTSTAEDTIQSVVKVEAEDANTFES